MKMDDPWHLVAEEQSYDITIHRGKENVCIKRDEEKQYDFLKSDVHWHNSEPVSSDVLEYVLANKAESDSYCWRIDSSTGIENINTTDHNDDYDNKSETSSTSSMNSDVCNSVESYAAITIPYIDIPTEASCSILKDVNYNDREDPLIKTKKEKPIKISPVFQSDPYFTSQRMLINKRQNDRLYTLNSTFKYLNNNLPPYVKSDDVRDNTKLGILRRAIKYINILSHILEEDEKKQNSCVAVIEDSAPLGSRVDVQALEVNPNFNTYVERYADVRSNDANDCADILQANDVIGSKTPAQLLGECNVDTGEDSESCVRYLLDNSNATTNTYVGCFKDDMNNSLNDPSVEFFCEEDPVKCVSILEDDNNTNDAYTDLLEEIDRKEASFIELMEGDTNT